MKIGSAKTLFCLGGLMSVSSPTSQFRFTDGNAAKSAQDASSHELQCIRIVSQAQLLGQAGQPSQPSIQGGEFDYGFAIRAMRLGGKLRKALNAIRNIVQGRKMFRVRDEDLYFRQIRDAMRRLGRSTRHPLHVTPARHSADNLHRASKTMLWLLALWLMFSTYPTLAQEQPKTLTPPEVTMDPNGVNLMTGKANRTGPEISIPAAPRLSYRQASDIIMYVSGEQHETTRLAKFSVEYGGNRSFTLEDFGQGVVERNSDSKLT